ncbi:MAG: DUF4347 domain-containing protein, partial [Desulfobacula sp.]|nr:DUF4347 domain-containing protein [Desulfobacula sp.]
MKSKKNLDITSCLLALESRIMYDAAGVAGIVDYNVDTTHNTTEPLVQDKAIHTGQDDAQSMLNLFEDFVPPAAASSSKEVIIIDSGVQNYQQLIQGVSADTRVIILDPSKDGLQQISSFLSKYQDLDAIHIVSHGNSESLHLGNAFLNLQALHENESQIQSWGQALGENGDIMLYGCDVAKGIEGQLFVHRLSELTQADVAASTDPTGHEILGGDWDLETQTGSIETAIAFSEQTREEYHNILADTPTALGSEFLISTPTTDYSPHPSVAALDGGGFVVVWEAFNQTGDGDSYGVFGQRYDAAGNPVAGEFVINTYTNANQHDAKVTGLDSGGFVVVWDSNGQDGSVHGVYTRVYSAAGVPITGEIQVNTITANNQFYPDVARLTSGNFVVVWESVNQDGDAYGVFGRQFNASGTPLTGEFQINTTFTSWQDSAAITPLSDGGFIVTWESFNQDGDQEGIIGQRWDSAATPVGSEFIINTTSADNQIEPSIASLADGGFVVVWASNNQDGSTYGSFGQKYDSSGVKVGGEFQVNTYTTNDQDATNVTGLHDGGFVVTWSSMGQDGSDWGIYGQRFDSSGNALGSEFLINTTTADAQDESSIATLENGDFVVVWESATGTYGTYGQLFTTNFSPVLDNTGDMALTSIPKTATDPLGDTVVDIIASAGGDRITDVDTGDPEGIAVTNVDELYGTWWFSTDNGSTWISMTGASNTSAVLLAADADTRVRFIPNGTNFGTNNITFRAWDQTSGSNGDTGVDTTNNGGNTPFSTATETASIYVDDIPVLVSGAVTAYTENDPATIIDSAITLTDDSANMVGASITISTNYIEGDDILSFTPVGSITGVWDEPSGTLTLSGVDTIANYQIALRSVTFESLSDDPDEMGGLSRTISFDVDDGLSTSPVVTSTVNITAVNDAPALVSGAVTAYTENDSAIVDDSAIVLTDDSTNMVGASITITTNYIEGDDILSFTPVGSITGVWDEPSGTLTLSGVDTIANYQIALRSVTFESSSDNPDEMGGLSRTISFDVDDGSSTSPVVTSTVNITAVDDIPVLVSGAVTSYTENDSATLVDSAITVTDDSANMVGA